MAKQIKFSYKDKEYTLEFTRKTVSQMEDEGFRVRTLDETPMTSIPTLFAGAFKAHHRFEKRAVIDEIYASIPNKEDLLQKLAEMYNEPILTLMDEPDAGNEGNVQWTTNW